MKLYKEMACKLYLAPCGNLSSMYTWQKCSTALSMVFISHSFAIPFLLLPPHGTNVVQLFLQYQFLYFFPLWFSLLYASFCNIYFTVLNVISFLPSPLLGSYLWHKLIIISVVWQHYIKTFTIVLFFPQVKLHFALSPPLSYFLLFPFPSLLFLPCSCFDYLHRNN